MIEKLFLFIAGGLLLAGCSSINIVSERVANEAEDRLSERKQLSVNSGNMDLLESQAGLFVHLEHPDLDAAYKEPLIAAVQEQFAGLGFFEQLRFDGALREQLEEDRQLRFKSEVYFDSLTTVAVSDRDIANPMGKYLGVGNFLVFQAVLWPCPTCNNRSIMRLKLRLVDTQSGLIVWTATAERELFEAELGEVGPISLELTELLGQMFESRFKTKWHKARFNNLAQR